MSEPNPNLDHLKTMLAEMAAETKELKSAAGGSITDVAALQRAGQAAARLQLDLKKLEHQRQKYQDAIAATQSKAQEYRDPKLPMSDEDRKAIAAKVDEIFGLA